ncbi:hypothetical protein B0H14DRAFT_3523214 [Mycena olivaceomarginata]|nr:hypothetical protein B0H14DRAFT_3523214 [Mycena olivaceomarginata]
MKIAAEELATTLPNPFTDAFFVFQDAMLWTPYSHQTRSGTIFATWTSSITSLQASEFDLGPLLSVAIAAESDEQEDSEPHDALNDIDKEWPPNPLNDIDKDWPPQDPWNETSAERQPSPRALKRMRKIAEVGFTPRASTLREHVQPVQPIYAPSFNASALPTAHGAYAAKVEGPAEKRGGKQRRSLAELIGLGFQLVRWDGLAARPLVDNAGRHICGPSLGSRTILNGTPPLLALTTQSKQRDQTPSSPQQCAATDAVFSPPSIIRPVVDRLLGNADINRLANFASSCGPLDFIATTVENNAKVRTRLSHLHRPFPKDVCNLPFGWCAIQSLGRFDVTQGGHLVLWDLKLMGRSASPSPNTPAEGYSGGLTTVEGRPSSYGEKTLRNTHG